MVIKSPAHIVFLCLMLFPALLAGQNKGWLVNADTGILKKLSPALKKNEGILKGLRNNQYLIEVTDTSLFYRYQRQYQKEIKVIKAPLPDFIIIDCVTERFEKLLANDFIVFADRALLSPLPEGYVISHDLSVNAIHATQQIFPDYDGNGEVVSVKEDKMDTADIDLAGRFVKTGVESAIGTTHATAMSTLIAGAGNSSFRGRGVATKSSYASSDFAGALPDASAIYKTSGINIQNHSYGVGIQNYYGANARAFDMSVIDNPALTHVFSSGNSGTLSATDGVYVGVTGYANITGNMKMAKNVLVVGAIDSNGVIPAASSRGPAYDGRLKPDLVAFAEDGSSGSAALVSGAVAVMQDAYGAAFGVSADAHIIRAILINAADDAGNEGPDFVAGFGNMNLFNAVQTVKNNRIKSGEIIPFSEDEYNVTIPPGSENLKITLAWNDPAAAALARKALINDLDLMLEHKPTNQLYLPWVLNFYPDRDSLSAPAKRGRDTLNNTEQITITSPLPGEYVIRVKSSFVQGGRQPYALVWQYDTTGNFEWMYPSIHAKLESGRKHILRWKASFPLNTMGILEWSSDSVNWQTIISDADIGSQKTTWDIPEIISPVWIRMKIASDVFVSGKIVVNPAPTVLVGYVCDSTLLYWNNPNSHDLWNVFRFNGTEMEKVKTTADTVFTVLTDAGSYFAVAPVVKGTDGFSGAAEDISQSGTGCFINNFLTDLINDQEVRIRVNLGTTYSIAEVVIEKIGNELKQIFKTSTDIRDYYEITDRTLTPGINSYRLKITLSNGNVVYSSINDVYYTASKNYLLFPVPAVRGEVIKLLQKEAKDIHVVITDAVGKQVQNYFFQDTMNEIPTGYFRGGLYLLRVTDEQGLVYFYKIIVL